MPLKESVIFTKLFLKLMRKDWPLKLEKISRFIEEHSTKNLKRIVKSFILSEFLTAHTIIIGVSCYFQLELVLFNNKKTKK